MVRGNKTLYDMKIIISIEKTLNVHQSLPRGLNAKRIKAHNTAVGCVKSISSLSNRLDGKDKVLY